MWLFDKIKALFSKLARAFKAFLDAAIPVVTQALLSEFKDFAINVVETLNRTGLSNKEKRNQAFHDIKKHAAESGKDLSDSLVNLLLELALQYIKNKVA